VAARTWGGDLSLVWILIGISLVALAVAILDRCSRIFSCLEWLRKQFAGEPPHIIIDRHPNLALEFFSIKEKIGPLYLMPLASTALEIKRMYEEVSKRFEETLEAWRDMERKEMEAFAATNPPEGKGFAPSDDLKRSLRAWSGERHRADVIEKWTYLFTSTYVELFSGKVTLPEAEERLKRVNSLSLGMRDHFAEAKIFNYWASNWEAESWRKRLGHLREMERWQKP
jgi:hypothetical protein